MARASADAPSGPRGGPIALAALILAGAAANLPDLFDANVFKTALAALLTAGVALPVLLWYGRDDARAWFSCAAARLHLAALLLAVPASVSVLPRAAVVDRLLLVAALHAAAVLGLGAARRGAGLAGPVAAAALVTAIAACLQAAGWERAFTPGPEEVVALMGNSTRAGGVLALGLVAAAALWLRRSSAASAAALALVSAALMLTRARAGRAAALVGLACVCWVCLRGPGRGRALARLLAPVALGVFLAGAAGGADVWLARKLPGSGPLLEGRDITAGVRLSLWRSTLRMADDGPFLGHGLGRFRERFGPYREPDEAARVGLGGAATHVVQPHNELLLGVAEGGWGAGACLLAFATAVLLRAGRRARQGRRPEDGAALGLLAAGTALALVQDAWTCPGTALPIFAAAGWACAPGGAPGPGAGRAPRRPPLLLLGYGLALALSLAWLAWPRLACHLGLRSFVRRAQVEGVNETTFALLERAAERDATDVDAQKLLVHYGTLLHAAAPDAGPALAEAVRRGRQRLRSLAPHER